MKFHSVPSSGKSHSMISETGNFSDSAGIKSKGWLRFQSQEKFIPGGSGTLSKVPRLYPDEPALIAKGKGCRFRDIDGNTYIDFRCALGPITLGYSYPQINAAIRRQLSNGIVFGHPTELEFQLAEELIEVIPCAESVRFLKTGGEAITAAIKLARAFTGRNMLLTCGYHGWLNITESTEGILPEVSASQRTFPYGDITEVERLLQQYEGKVAAVSLAGAYDMMGINDDFPRRLRELTHRYKVLLIIDEIVTGFRLRIGGFHEYYDFLPDLAIFSKGMANGMPISIFCGRKEIMDLSANRAMVTSTFSGETLSIAAALALLKIYRERNVIAHLWEAGEAMSAGMDEIFKRYGLPVVLKGLSPCKFLDFEAETSQENARLEEALFRTFYRHGISMFRVCYVNYSHKKRDITEALERIDQACGDIRFEEKLRAEPAFPKVGVFANRS